MEFSANQIAALVNGTVEGDGDITVNTFAKIEEGQSWCVVFSRKSEVCTLPLHIEVFCHIGITRF